MSTITSPTVVKSFDTVCDALRDVHDEASLWRLSDELVKIAPKGVEAVEKVVQQAQVRGIPTKSVNTLRLYRDVAIRFPATERVPLVTFSAHREAIAIGDAKQARAVLEELAKKHGAANVTVTTVKQAIGAATGKVPTAPKAHTAQSSYSEVAQDLSIGHGKKFIAALDEIVGVHNVTLDGLHAGLSAVLGAVEVRRAKAARKAAAAPKAGTGAVVDPKKSVAARKAIAAAKNGTKPAGSGKAAVKVGAGKAGDLRDL